VGRPSGSKTQKRPIPSALRRELEIHIERGQCAYCRAPARPDQPLTREHVIPRARGGGRKDFRIMVPACARCNHHRGCSDLIPFLLARPQRISSFLDYLSVISPDCIRELDQRIFAEIYAAVAILVECAAHGREWRFELDRLCSGRSLHRRRYATRRAVGFVSSRVESLRDRGFDGSGPGCLLPSPRPDVLLIHIEEPLERMASRLLSLLALVWEISAEAAEREMTRALSGTAVHSESLVGAMPAGGDRDSGLDGVLPLDGWSSRPKRKRLRTDRRHGRASRGQRSAPPARGRAA